jgi:cardiolipin synthase A/B
MRSSLTWREKTILDDLTLLVLLGTALAAALLAAGHALLHKRDPRSALVWVSLSLTIPFLGPFSYWMFGINRITRRAHKWHKSGRRPDFHELMQPIQTSSTALPPLYLGLHNLETLADRVARTRTSDGNRIMPLVNGEQAYPAMLAAIGRAESTIHLSSYIFDGDKVGAGFVAALTAAAQRGVMVRVIVDAMGERYSKVTARRALSGSGVDIRHYLPLYKGPFINLRNHRKLLVVDGEHAFTGGMNIRSNHCVETALPSQAASDLHFQVQGPVVWDLQRIFLEDWYFVSGQLLDAPDYFPRIDTSGTALARAIADGPDREFRKLEWIVMGALASASRKVSIMTPYFIPDRPMVTALVTAALRGVEVTLVLPQLNNLPFVAWASRASYWELIKNGVCILEQPPPFAHTKLLLVDDIWSLIGSANLDTRSFRLNFELNLSVFDQELTTKLTRHFNTILAVSHRIALQEMDQRSLPIKLRDGAARLFSPYL